MQVSEIMSADVLSVGPDDPLTKFFSLMEEEHIHEAPVIENKKLLGMINFDIVSKKGITDPSKQKSRSVMEAKPPTFKPDLSVEDAAKLLLNSGWQAAPVVEGQKVIGIVSFWDIDMAVSSSKLFRQTLVEAVMSPAEVLSENADIGSARVTMRERNISRMPVVNNDGKLVGIIATHDLLRSVKHPHEKMGFYEMAAEMDKISAIPVTTIMNNNPPTITKTASLNEVAAALQKYNCSGLTVTESGVPIGIVTLKDLLEVYVGSFAKKGIYYQTTGLDKEDDTVIDTVHRMIGDTFTKIASVVPIQHAFVHYKKHESGGLRTKWSVRFRVMTDRGTFMSKAWAWDARDATKDAMHNLERIFLKWKEEKKDKYKKSAKLMRGR